jgi:glycosyltransferase involved in cell wall biosynthesis
MTVVNPNGHLQDAVLKDTADAVPVSVIITTYNRPRYLEITLKSVIEQDYNNLEVIVVDDGTEGDDNRRVCSQWPQVQYYKIKNSGSPIVPRNWGFKLSQGVYVAFLDDDDVWLPNKIKRQVEILNQHPDYGLVHGCCRIIDSAGNETGEIAGRLKIPHQKHGDVFDGMVGNFTVMMPTPLIRRDLIEKIGGFNEAIPAAGEDMEFFCHLAYYAKFYYIDEPLALYRVHGGNISSHNQHYTHLPLVLFRLVNRLRQKGLERHRFVVIRNRLIQRQLDVVVDAKTLWIALIDCFKITPFFWGSPQVIKTILKKVFVSSKAH